MPNRQRLTNTLIDLIKIDSPTGEEDAIDAHLSGRLTALGATVQHDSYGNLVATLPAANGSNTQPPRMLSAHMDTVEPGRGIKPSLDADGETLRSDGSTILGGDCKAGIAIVLEGLTAAIEDGTPRVPLQVVFLPRRGGRSQRRPQPGFFAGQSPHRHRLRWRRPGEPRLRRRAGAEHRAGHHHRGGGPCRPGAGERRLRAAGGGAIS